jgi:myosin heavy subunit
LNIDRLYPRVIPATSYLAAALLALLIGLNFLPLPWNHNWVYLQAAPAFSLTDAERNFLAQAQQLLAKIDLLDKGDLAARIEEIMKELQEGKIDVAEASKELEEIQKRLGTKVLDTAAIDNKLNEIAEDFKAAEQQLKEAAEALQERNLEDTASRMKKAAEDLEATAESLKDQDKQAANRAMKDAEFLKDLSEKIQDRQFKDQAVRELQNLTESLQQRDANSQTAKSAAKERGEGEGEIQPVEGEPGKDDTGSAPTDSPSEGGSAQNPSGRHGNDAPVEGPPTQKLDVQLQQEQLTGQHDQEVKPEEIEQTSKQERSKLDYRNVPSELSAAQKDVLNQESIPWQYRRLIKNYFAAIQPRHKDNK